MCARKTSPFVTSTPNKNQVFEAHQPQGFIIKKDNLCYFAVPPTPSSSSVAVDSKPVKKDLLLQVPQDPTPSFLIKKGDLYFHVTPPSCQSTTFEQNRLLKTGAVPSPPGRIENKIYNSSRSAATEQRLPSVRTISSKKLSLREKINLQQRKFYSNKRRHRSSLIQNGDIFYNMLDNLKSATDPKKCVYDSSSNKTDQENCNVSSSFKETESKQKTYLSYLQNKLANIIDVDEQSKKSGSFLSTSKSFSFMEHMEKSVKKISLNQYKERRAKNSNQNVPEKSKMKKSEESGSRERKKKEEIRSKESSQSQEEYSASSHSSSQKDATKREKSLHHPILNRSKIDDGKSIKTSTKKQEVKTKPEKSKNQKFNDETKPLISKRSFYGDKSKHSGATKVKQKDEEDPVILTLSSDDEDENEDDKIKPSHDDTSSSKPKDKNYDEELFSMITGEDFVALKCKSVFIGSYRVVPKARLKLSKGCFTMIVPPIPKDMEPVKLVMKRIGIVQVGVNFEDEYPVFILYIKPSMATYIVNQLKMSCESGPYLDPRSKDERKHRITIITEKIKPEFILSIKEFWNDSSSQPSSPSLMVEISSEDAAEIIERVIPPIDDRDSDSSQRNQESKLFVYPPPPQNGGITITTSDYCCLEEEQFLNDVIIDFYLRWLMLREGMEKESERTHIFSTFFYKRLTSKPKSKHSRLEEAAMTPAQRRHSRVQSWTKNIDIFSKDFILVPINEHSHWFLAVICFPGLDGPIAFNEKEPFPLADIVSSRETSSLKQRNKRFKIPFLSDPDPELSDRDEAEGDEDEDLHEYEDTEKKTNIKESHQKSKDLKPIKQPCILIFDSLPGSSPLRIVATLRDYLAIEYEKKKKKKKVFNKESMKGVCPKVPQQSNFSDCGLYTLQYAESFFECPLKDFRFPIRTLKDWFSEFLIQRKRKIIADLIKQLLIEHNPNEEIKLPRLRFASEKAKEREERREKLAEVRKYGNKRKECDPCPDKNSLSSIVDNLIKYPKSSCLFTAKKMGVEEEVSQQAKKLKCNSDDSLVNFSRQPIVSPLNTSDDNDSGHHSDIDDSREFLNNAFLDGKCSSKGEDLNSENTLESNSINSFNKLQNILESNDPSSRMEVDTSNDSSLLPSEKRLYGKYYEARKSKLSLAYRRSDNSVTSELPCSRTISNV